MLNKEYLGKVGVLFGGSGLSQILYFLGTILVARIYSPEEFGFFAQAMALIAPLALVSSLRMEFAISLPKDEEDSLSIFLLAVGIALCFCGILFVLMFTAKHLDLLPSIPVSHVVAIILGVAFTAIYSALNYWMIFRGEFSVVATAKPVQAGFVTLGQVCFGSIGLASIGLLIGQVAGQGLSLLYLIRKFMSDDLVGGGSGLKAAIRNCSNRAKSLLSRYRKFPLVSTPAGLMNVLSNYLPVILIAAYEDIWAAGLYGLMQRVVAGPLAILSGPFLDVFKEHSARERRNTGAFKEAYKSTLFVLVGVGFIPCLVLYILGEWLFTIAFGSEWTQAGTFASILSLMLYLRFIASPLSFSLIVAEKQREDLIWQAVLLGSTICVFMFGSKMLSINEIIFGYGIVYSGLYVINLFMTASAAGLLNGYKT